MSRCALFANTKPRHILIVPGIGNSGPEHWQSLWQSEDQSALRVQQRDWDHPVCTQWCAALDDSIARAGHDVIIAAHSLGCLTVAHWAMTTSKAISGALLVAPPDPDGPSFPVEVSGFAPVPSLKLKFPTILVASADDPYGSLEFAKHCADSWGSRFVNVGPAGHINASSGLGRWEQGRRLLQDLLAG